MASGDTYHGEISEGPTASMKVVYTWSVVISLVSSFLYQVVQLQFAGIQKKGSFSFQWR